MTDTRHARRRALIDGMVAAAPALAVGWVAHRGAPRIPFAPTAVADRVIRLTPGDIATAAIERLHHTAQHLLAAAVVAAFIAVAAIAARQLRSARWAAAAWSAALLLGALWSPVQLSLPGAAGAAALGGALYGLALHALRRPRAAPAHNYERRRALATIGGFTVAALAASHPLGRAFGWLSPGPQRLTAGRVPRGRTAPRPAFPRVPGLTPEITSVADHYIVDIDINDPLIDGPSWRLDVGGLVERPMRLSFFDLQRDFPVRDEISVLTCISNEVGGPLVGNSRWEGVRIADILARTSPKPSASTIVVRCADGYCAAIPVAAARHPSALAAIAQDGEALSSQHGFPCRLRLPALYGMLNPKWVTSMELVDHPRHGYWARQGWSPTAVVRTESRIDTPRHARVGKPTWIAGTAWAGIRGIRRVELSLDGGRTWDPARLHRPLSPWAWTQWAYLWTPRRHGRQSIQCRATDGRGAAQDPMHRAPHPSGASGYHRVEVEVT